MSYYDPHRVFNHRRTAEQRKGQSIQNRLIDTVEPRVDPEVLRKAKRLCEVYNLIPTPTFFKLELDDVTIEGDYIKSSDFIIGLLTTNQAPSGKYIAIISCKNGIPYYTGENSIWCHPIDFSTFQYDSNSQQLQNPYQRHYTITFNKGNFPSDTTMSCIEAKVENETYSTTYFQSLRPNAFKKNLTYQPTIETALYTVLIYQIPN